MATGVARLAGLALVSFGFNVIGLSQETAATPNAARSNTTTSHIGQPWRDCAECPAVVTVPAGRFVMGSDLDGEAGRPE